MERVKFGNIILDLIEIASRGNAVLGIRDSGKTYTATEIAEVLMDFGVPIVAFDPTGVWPNLRVPGKGKGYPVVVVGGDHGDLPITVADAPKYLRAAMGAGVSIVFDMLDRHLSKADWRRIVTECVRILIYENKQFGLRHVFIEEAAEFVPQRVGRENGQVYAEMEKLARIGGNSRLGFTIINQRAEEVNKAVLELCDNLFLHRQKGRLSLTALRKWLDIGNVDGDKIMASMSELPSGQCWTWLKDGGAPKLLKVPAKNSAHPDRRAMMTGDAIKTRKPVDVSTFITNMKARLVSKPATQSPQRATMVNPPPSGQTIAAQRKMMADEFHRGELSGERASKEAFRRDVERLRDQIKAAFGAADHLIEKLITKMGSPGAPPSHTPAPMPAPVTARHRQTVGEASAADTPSGDLTKAMQNIVDAVAWWRSIGVDAPQKNRVAYIAGIAPTGGTFRTYISRAKTDGLITTANKCIRLTEEGARHARSPEEPVTKEHLRARVLSIAGESLAKMLTPLIECYPASMSKETLGRESGYACDGGTFRTYLSRLRVLDVIEPDPEFKGRLKASPLLF